MASLTASWGIGCGRQLNGQREGEVTDVLWNSKCAGITWPFTSTLNLSTRWMGTIVCKFGGDPAIYLREEAICAKSSQTDRRTDRRRTPRHCISSLEWAKNTQNNYNQTMLSCPIVRSLLLQTKQHCTMLPDKSSQPSLWPIGYSYYW